MIRAGVGLETGQRVEGIINQAPSPNLQAPEKLQTPDIRTALNFFKK